MKNSGAYGNTGHQVESYFQNEAMGILKVDGSFLGTWQRHQQSEVRNKEGKKAFLKRKVRCSVAFLKVSPMSPQA